MIILAFDTSTSHIACAFARVGDNAAGDACLSRLGRYEILGSADCDAPRSSNQQLMPHIDALAQQLGISPDDIGCVACGRGPGSFTGVRIGVATAKGVATGLHVPLHGVSTLDAVAWRAWQMGTRGELLVAGDAMRKEVYPVRYRLGGSGIERLSSDMVSKAVDVAASWADATTAPVTITGDGLARYRAMFESSFSEAGKAGLATFLGEDALYPTGESLVAAYCDMAARDALDSGDAGAMLPVYTRLSDAEENERKRIGRIDTAGTGAAQAGGALASVPRSGVADALAEGGLILRPMAISDVKPVCDVEHASFTGDAAPDAWSEAMFVDEFERMGRSWWVACEGGRICGVCGGMLVDGQMQLLDIAVAPDVRGQGIATKLLARLAHDARDLGASEMTLEVRVENTPAQSLYASLGFENLGRRPHYYPGGTDAFIMTALLPLAAPSREGRENASGDTLVDVAASAAEQEALAHAAEREALAHAAEREALAHAAEPVVAAAYGAADTAVAAGDAAADGGAAGVSPLASKRPLILAFESSCDETAAAVIDGDGLLHSDIIASQVDFHARFGGVVPEIASRKHIEAIVSVAEEALARASASLGACAALPGEGAAPLESCSLESCNLESRSLDFRDLDAIAVTSQPGLVGALVVGVAFAKGLSWACSLPLIAVNHLEGHLFASRLFDPSIEPPLVALLVSGGNTLLVHVRSWGSYETLGSTLDDAVGEAFDKVSKALGLGYPGGPVISRLAKDGNPAAYDFPRAMLRSGDLMFSLSGLKTAVITVIKDAEASGAQLDVPGLAASFQQAVVDVLVAKVETALEQTGATRFVLGGGVAANPALRSALAKELERRGVDVSLPPLPACTDNAGMIAAVALSRFRDGKFANLSLDAYANGPLEDIQ